MIHNKFRYLLTLVALLAVTTGAWADETPLVTIESKNYVSFKSGSKTFDDKVTVTFSDEVYNDGDTDGWYASGPASLLTVAGINGYTITSCKFYTKNGTAANGYTVEGESPSVYLYVGKVYTDDSKTVEIGYYGISKIEVYGAAASSASAVEVDWNKTSKTGTFTMPAYDVELQVEYYPGMLTLGSGAIEGGKLEVVGMTDDALPAGFEKDEEGNIYVEPGTVIKVKVVPDEGYRLVSLTDGTNDIEVDADGIATITMPDEYADFTLTATFSNEYTVALNAEGLSDEEAANWKAATGDNDPAAFPLENVKYGTEVKVTYTGTRKVIGVKAEKKASTPTLKDALADGATVVIKYVWDGDRETTFTYTKNGSKYTGNTTGWDAEYFANGMSIDGTTLKFTASNPDYSQANVSIDFFTDTNEYVASKGSYFTSFTISVNGTDITSQLTEVK